MEKKKSMYDASNQVRKSIKIKRLEITGSLVQNYSNNLLNQ